MPVGVRLVAFGVRVAPLVVREAQCGQKVRTVSYSLPRGGRQGRELVWVPGGLADFRGGVRARSGILGVGPLA